ncbi:GPI mannosyltransferase 4 [Penicillium brasilianum]|uniref:Mannosyltransferase n=1 Tax=Penicillium brasilianum TaxID=104259 RepID=A0A1S9RRJ8_PENBI|nr:GPI mannosyltransferase 4 [Penicillium brasilianum]
MWRRTYLLLLLIRVYFALSPSYLHPDENFQGPEVYAGRIFGYPSKLPWEFTVDHPIRSVFPLWPTYEVPMSLLHWFYTEYGSGNPPPQLVYYALRAGMFLLSFVLEDWAIYELVPSPRHRRATVVLVASSYVTWTYQTHTFSNSLETLLVAWGLVLIRRILENKQRSSFFSYAVLSFIAVAGVFNRITFPAFLLIPGLQLLPYFQRKPSSLVAIIGFGALFSSIAIYTDTLFYRPSSTFLSAIRNPIITPLNNLLYNSDTSNLATHGLHPHHQHFTANLLQLLGPVYIVMIFSLFRNFQIPTWLRNARAVSALSATLLLSIFPHQEPRFLIPLRGIVPAQLAMRTIVSTNTVAQGIKTNPDASVFWWKTYSPPQWLLGAENSSTPAITTLDLMGIPGVDLIQRLDQSVPPCGAVSPVYLVAPTSATFLDEYAATGTPRTPDLQLYRLWTYRKHLNLDDLDFGDDGIVPTLARGLRMIWTGKTMAKKDPYVPGGVPKGTWSSKWEHPKHVLTFHFAAQVDSSRFLGDHSPTSARLPVTANQLWEIPLSDKRKTSKKAVCALARISLILRTVTITTSASPDAKFRMKCNGWVNVMHRIRTLGLTNKHSASLQTDHLEESTLTITMAWR